MASKNLLRRDFIQRTTLGTAGLAAGVRPRRARAGQEPQEIEGKVNKLVSDNKFVPSEWRQEVRNAVESIKSRSPQALNLVLKSLEADDERLNAEGKVAFVHARAKLFGDIHELIREKGSGLHQRDLEDLVKLASENAVYVGLIRQSTRVKEVNDLIKEMGVGGWVKHVANFGLLDQPFHNPFKTVYELAQKHKAYEKFTKLDDELFGFLDDILKNKAGIQRRRLLPEEKEARHLMESHIVNKERTLDEALKEPNVKVGSLPYAIYHVQAANMFGIPAGVAWAAEIHPQQTPQLHRPFAFHYNPATDEFHVTKAWGEFNRDPSRTHAASVIWWGAPRHAKQTFTFPRPTAYTTPRYLREYAEPPATADTVYQEHDFKGIPTRARDITEKMPQVLPREKIGYVDIKSRGGKQLKGFGVFLVRERTPDSKAEFYNIVHWIELKGRSVRVALGAVPTNEYRFVFLHPDGTEISRSRRLFHILPGRVQSEPIQIRDDLIPD